MEIWPSAFVGADSTAKGHSPDWNPRASSIAAPSYPLVEIATVMDTVRSGFCILVLLLASLYYCRVSPMSPAVVLSSLFSSRTCASTYRPTVLSLRSLPYQLCEVPYQSHRFALQASPHHSILRDKLAYPRVTVHLGSWSGVFPGHFPSHQPHSRQRPPRTPVYFPRFPGFSPFTLSGSAAFPQPCSA